MDKRNATLDIIRILACLMVILMHSPYPGIGTPGYILSGISYLTAPCIGLFFMVSGALLLNLQNFNPGIFIKKRFSKILFPTLLWTFIGYALSYVGIPNDENAILWFMYCLAGLYLLTPILVRWLEKASQLELELYLCIWFITLCIPFIKLICPINESDSSWLYYFHGYAGYFLLGYYLNRFGLNGNRLKIFTGTFILFSIICPILFFILEISVDFYSLFWYLSITVALCCIFLWMLCFKIQKVSPIITTFSRLSFGVYLIHILIMRNIIWPLGKNLWTEFGGFFQILVTFILTTILAFLITWLISKTKISKYIIGI